MNIGQLSEITGISRDTIRYYEKIGLFGSEERGENNYRIYSERAIVTLNFIKMAQFLGFSLKEINKYLSDIMDGHARFSDIEAAIEIKIAETEDNILKLRENTTRLKGILANCPRSSQVSDCL